MNPLRIGARADGSEFALPLDLVTQSIAILAKKRVGKSYTSAVIAEELLAAGQQVVIVDPTGAHWGLRSSADGRAAGFPIVVFGGDHADLPLDETAGEALARAVVDQRFSAILDLSLLRKGATTRFLCAFFETLYRLNREPLQLICDEADVYAPQKPFADEARTLGAMEDIVRRGGIRGIGTTLITQRPAVVNKNVLTQCEVLIALRLVHPKDIAAIMEWVNVHAESAAAKRMLDSLPSLPIGTAWFWSPGWGDIFEQVQVRRRTTFDSGATPKPGERVIAPKVLAAIDVERLGAEIAATAERAKADDPKELHRRIAELERQVASKAVAQQVPDEALIAAAEAMGRATGRQEMLDVHSGLIEVQGAVAAALAAATERMQALPTLPSGTPVPVRTARVTRIQLETVYPAAPKPAKASAAGTAKLSKAERGVLTALAQYPRGRTKNQVAILTGYAVNGGGFNNAISACRSRGLLAGTADEMFITQEGIAGLGAFEPLPHGDALLQHWYSQLGKAERACLAALVGAHPKALTKEALAQRAGYEAGGGGFNNALSRLRTFELISGRGELRASDDLFN